MAELVITIPACDPDEPKVTLQFDPPVPPPAFIEIEDADGTVHRYVPAETARVKAERDELAAAIRAVENGVPGGWDRVRLAVAACERRRVPE